MGGEVSSVLGCSMKGQKMFRNAEISDENARSSLQYNFHSGDSAVMLGGRTSHTQGERLGNTTTPSRKLAPGGSFEHSLGMAHLKITY